MLNSCKCSLLKKKYRQLLKPLNSYNSYCYFHVHKVNTNVHGSLWAKACFRLSDLEIQLWATFHPLMSNRKEQRVSILQPLVFSELWGKYPACPSHLLQAVLPGSQSESCAHSEVSILRPLLQCCHQMQVGCLPQDYCFSTDWHILWGKTCNREIPTF